MPPSQRVPAATQPFNLPRDLALTRAEPVPSAVGRTPSTTMARNGPGADERSGVTTPPAYDRWDITDAEYERLREDEEDLKEVTAALKAARKWRATLVQLLHKKDNMGHCGHDDSSASSSRPAADVGSAERQGREHAGEAADVHDLDKLDGYIPALGELDALDGYIENLQEQLAEPGYTRRAMNAILYNQPPEVLKAREEAYQRTLADFFAERAARS